MSERRILIANRHPRLRVDRRAVAKLVEALDACATRFLGGCPPGELSLVFLTDAALAQLHADFLNDPSATDVITFEGPPSIDPTIETQVAGEICVSVDAALRHAGRAAKSSRAQNRFSEELTLYVVHGW